MKVTPPHLALICVGFKMKPQGILREMTMCDPDQVLRFDAFMIRIYTFKTPHLDRRHSSQKPLFFFYNKQQLLLLLLLSRAHPLLTRARHEILRILYLTQRST